MSTVKQVGLLPAGCQPWNTDVCAASGDRFAYCATLAIYIYQLDRQSNEFKLHSIMSEHKKTITAISWHPRNPDVIASGSADNQIIIWNIAEQQVMAKLNKIRHAPCSIGWCFHEKDSVGFVYLRGPLFLWNFTAGSGVAIHKDAQNFSSDVCQFRWHHKKMGKMVFGHTNGSLSFFFPDRRSQRHVLRPEELEDSNEDDPIAALEWDPLSVEYLLVANTHQGVRLIDSEAVSVIMKFQLPSAAAEVHTLAWINSAPGMFLTGDTQSGVMRLWNVSKSTPIENIRLKKTGFHAMSVFSTVPSIATNNNAGEEESAHVSSTSLAMGPSVSSSRYALPPGHAVCTFLDGGVGLYDLGKRKWNFLRDLGHIETIFDCKFKPDNPDLLATGSFDGTIKIWNVNTMTAIHTSPGNEGVIYCLSWAPADLNCVAGCTSRQGAFIWDITKGKVIKRFSEHGKSAVYSVAWNRKDSRRIATCGADGYCIVRQVDGQLIQKYKHPAPVFGCDWSTNNKDMIATGCEDKCVRVFYLATTSDQPLKVFTGHTAKVFQVKWSPLREGILCSGSDDGTIRIWDYTQDSCQSTLVGHSAPVRGLLWSSEIPYLLISGSWDYSIRIWDTRDGACIDTVLDHGADVYGLTCHPERPFTLASCSRDSTVRIWSLTPLVQPLEMNIIASRPWTDIVATPEYAMSHGTPPLLSGKVSKDLKMQIDKIQTNTYTRTLRWFSKFFAGPGGADNLWELVNVINGIDDSLLSPKYGTGIMHIKHITRFKGASAQELEMAKLAKKTIGIGSVNKEDQLRQAADIHIKMGNIQRYCELMVELGEWDKALSVSPGVSVDYWKSLCDRRAQFLMKEENDDCIPFSIASGDSQKVIRYMTSRGQLQDAMLVATSAYEGNIAPPRSSRSKNKNQVNGLDETADNYSVQLHTTSRELANWYFHNGSPILAACCHLAVDDCEGAMAKLIRGNELELAVSVGTVLQKVKDLLHLAVELLARRCEKIGRWDLAVDLLKTIPEPEEALIKLCARCNGSMIEINDLHAKAGLPSMEECQQRAESLKSNSDPMECIEFYLLSPVPETGLEIGLEYIKRVMTSSKWQADDIFPYLSLLGCIKTEKLQQHKCAKMRSELLALCAYVGGLVAIRRQYNTIVQALFKHAMQCMQRDGAEIPISLSLMSAELEAWRTHQYITGKIPGSPSRKEHTMSKEMKPTLDELFVKAGEEASDLGVGCDYVTGAHLPCHSDVHESFFTGQRIQGPAYFLEDGRSAVSINDAMMWAKVNPFSPLGSGMRINPF